jgi:hypothetical protein
MIRIVITHRQIEPSGVKSTWWVIPAIAGVIVWVLTFAITLGRLLVEEFTISALQKLVTKSSALVSAIAVDVNHVRSKIKTRRPFIPFLKPPECYQ